MCVNQIKRQSTKSKGKLIYSTACNLTTVKTPSTTSDSNLCGTRVAQTCCSMVQGGTDLLQHGTADSELHTYQMGPGHHKMYAVC